MSSAKVDERKTHCVGEGAVKLPVLTLAVRLYSKKENFPSHGKEYTQDSPGNGQVVLKFGGEYIGIHCIMILSNLQIFFCAHSTNNRQ